LQFRSEFCGIIPAAGSGERLGLPYPKELHSVEPSKLYIDYCLEQMANAGLQDVYIVVSPDKLSPMAQALGPRRRGLQLTYVERASYVSKSLIGSVLLGARRANYQLEYEKFLIMLPDTKMSCPDVAKTLISMQAPTFALFDTPDPSQFDSVYGAASSVSRIAVKIPVVDIHGSYKGTWGAFTLDMQAVVRLRKRLKATEASPTGDHHLTGNLIDADIRLGSQYYYVQLPGTYDDLGEWDRVHKYIGGLNA
jgi:choline kinase